MADVCHYKDGLLPYLYNAIQGQQELTKAYYHTILPLILLLSLRLEIHHVNLVLQL
jgi:hypothetical protein